MRAVFENGAYISGLLKETAYSYLIFTKSNYMLCPSYLPRVNIVTIRDEEYERSEYSPQHPILKNPQSLFS
jgi:hypothetical protein